mmetsp:Transcript_22269/g.33259  ORF Transcript_22269/g.33259 Transcript_22269/m.33259 type:complete len:202 (+) Transcript_22269:57-662(+)
MYKIDPTTQRTKNLRAFIQTQIASLVCATELRQNPVYQKKNITQNLGLSMEHMLLPSVSTNIKNNCSRAITNDQTNSSSPKNNEIKKESKEGSKKTNKDLSWDDADYELPNVSLLHEPKCAVSSTGNEDSEDSLDGDEDWIEFKVQTLPESIKPITADGEKYLTDQFKRLNTPASRKKARCSICTRPLSDVKNSRFCNRCK